MLDQHDLGAIHHLIERDARRRGWLSSLIASMTGFAGTGLAFYMVFSVEHERLSTENQVNKLEALIKEDALIKGHSRTIHGGLTINSATLVPPEGAKASRGRCKAPEDDPKSCLYEVSVTVRLINGSDYAVVPILETLEFESASADHEIEIGRQLDQLDWSTVLQSHSFDNEYLDPDELSEVEGGVVLYGHTQLQQLDPDEQHTWTQTWYVSAPKGGWIKAGVHWKVDADQSSPDYEYIGWSTWTKL